MFVQKLCVLLAVTCFVGAADPCQTPRGESGDCVPIPDCPPLLLLFQNSTITAKNARFVRTHHCGFVGKTPKVCCAIPSSDLVPAGTCGRSIQAKILGGNETELDEFPWMALLEYKKSKRSGVFDCGGVLISKKYVLTAAHCIKKNLISVRLGEHDTQKEIDCMKTSIDEVCAPKPINIAVEERIAHENYDPDDINQYHDIALVRLKEEVPFSDYIKPICLPSKSAEMTDAYLDQRLFVAGWGITNTGETSNVKLKVQLPVKDKSDCETIYRNFNYNLNLTQSQLCAGGEKGKDSCRGDSGGPLMTTRRDKDKDLQWYAAGVVSFGANPCGMQDWPGIYVRVSDYVPWIFSKLRP